MSWVKDNFFGGAEKEAAKRETAHLEQAQDIVREQSDIARTDVNRLFGQQEQNARAGIQTGLDLYGQTIPAQFDQQRQGNLQAQQMLSGGLQQQNNAILGGNIDYSQFQPRQTTPVDMNMFNVQTPNYIFADGTDNFTPEPSPTQIPTTGYPNQFLSGDWFKGGYGSGQSPIYNNQFKFNVR